jgi:hypothetical protein
VASGVINEAGQAASTSDIYAWGSVTKTFTGAAIMKHVAAGRLSLDEAAAPHVDAMLRAARYPYNMESLFSADQWAVAPAHQYSASNITIRHLLHMVSGVTDYDTNAFRHLQFAHPKVDFSPLDLLDYVHAPLMFPPGGTVNMTLNYCSINYILLGLIAAHLDGVHDWRAWNSVGRPTALGQRRAVRFRRDMWQVHGAASSVRPHRRAAHRRELDFVPRWLECGQRGHERTERSQLDVRPVRRGVRGAAAKDSRSDAAQPEQGRHVRPGHLRLYGAVRQRDRRRRAWPPRRHVYAAASADPRALHAALLPSRTARACDTEGTCRRSLTPSHEQLAPSTHLVAASHRGARP